MAACYIFFILSLVSTQVTAQEYELYSSAENCSAMEVWDYAMGMCMPLPMAGMPMKMAMLHGNSFLMQTFEKGPRGRSALSIPNMFMADLGSTSGDHHYINLDVMATVEKWTFPENGTPELLQIGENQANGQPFLDAQHPHSSPLMGLTLSDTIAFGSGKDHAQLSFAPRGQASDGPVAFMHRPTGMVNPDAPLGHHIGQDVGHISSTVIAASVRLSNTTLETSTFNGTEPSPTTVDLPLARPNSYAARLTQQFLPNVYAMTSVAYVKSPESNEPTLDHIWRYSTSLYANFKLAKQWSVHEALIWGLINFYDETSALNSFAEEFWFKKSAHNIWGRIEVLQRTSAELQVAATGDTDRALWVTALTIGYTHDLLSWNETHLGLGGSVTEDILPAAFKSAYGESPRTAKVFLQLSGMAMWDFD